MASAQAPSQRARPLLSRSLIRSGRHDLAIRFRQYTSDDGSNPGSSSGAPIAAFHRTSNRAASAIPIRKIVQHLQGQDRRHPGRRQRRPAYPRRGKQGFTDLVKDRLRQAEAVHADETPARAAGGLRYVHLACTAFLTHMHTGDRSADAVDAGGALPGYQGILVRDGYHGGYGHLTAALHAWCGT